jgi:hypothetical protein
MNISVDLDREKLREINHDMTIGMSRVYEGITRHYGWPFELPVSSNIPVLHRRKAPNKGIEAEATGNPANE